ncbi:MAG: hypothetical protein WD139_05155 [Balneolaceae bacterium]
MDIRNIKTYEEFYRLGFDYFINKKIIGLKKPKARQRIFYLTLITGLIFISSI